MFEFRKIRFFKKDYAGNPKLTTIGFTVGRTEFLDRHTFGYVWLKKDNPTAEEMDRIISDVLAKDLAQKFRIDEVEYIKVLLKKDYRDSMASQTNTGVFAS